MDPIFDLTAACESAEVVKRVKLAAGSLGSRFRIAGGFVANQVKSFMAKLLHLAKKAEDDGTEMPKATEAMLGDDLMFLSETAMEGFFGKKGPNWNDSHNATNELAPFFISKKSSFKSSANGPKRYYVHTDDDFGNFCTSLAQSIKKNYLWDNEVPLMILGMSTGKGNTVVGMLRSDWESMTTVSIGALYVSCDKDLRKIWDGSLKVSEFTVTLEYDEYWHIGSAPVQTPTTVIMLGSSTYEITGNKSAAESEMPTTDSFEPAQDDMVAGIVSAVIATAVTAAIVWLTELICRGIAKLAKAAGRAVSKTELWQRIEKKHKKNVENRQMMRAAAQRERRDAEVIDGHTRAEWHAAVDAFIKNHGATINGILTKHQNAAKSELNQLKNRRPEWKGLDVNALTEFPSDHWIEYTDNAPSWSCSIMMFGYIVDDEYGMENMLEDLSDNEIQKKLDSLHVQGTTVKSVKSKTVETINAYLSEGYKVMTKHAENALEEVCKHLGIPAPSEGVDYENGENYVFYYFSLYIGDIKGYIEKTYMPKTDN